MSETAPTRDPAAPVSAEVVIIGAGPCGLFQVFELGLLGISAHVVDSLQHPGGQCAELYPDKPIYDIPAIPVCGAQELVDRLLQQIKPFKPQLHLGHEVVAFTRRADGRFRLSTSAGTHFDTGAVVIAGGVGSFQPRRIGLEGAEAFEGGAIQYRVKNAGALAGKRVVIFGGGDSALDWTLELLPRVAALTLVHRRAEFRAAPASVAKMHEQVSAGRMQYFEALPHSLIVNDGALRGVNIKSRAAADAGQALPADQLLVFFGLHPKLGQQGGSVFGLGHRAGFGVVRAKTGNLSTVAALAGTAYARNGQLLAFAVMADRIPKAPGALVRAATAMVNVASALAGCGCH